jgi:hypothetical protein
VLTQNVIKNLTPKHTTKNIVQMSVAGFQLIKELWKSTTKKKQLKRVQLGYARNVNHN